MHDHLLAAIRARQQKQSSFGYGILTADRYVSTLKDCVGIDACYKYAATRQTSFDDVLRKAAQTLVYSNEDMVLEDNGVEFCKAAGSAPKKFDDVELPKNTLMVFRHVLTTPRKDRDGDILRTQGAVVDPKMLLLWQHVHTLPIGKMLLVQEHNSKKLSIVSCIVDMNDLSHDSAVMIDNGMGRFSHGFRALEFDEMKAEGGSGFDVKKFEIMEASLVSVPSNVDAEVQEVMLSLVEGGKLTSPIMKAAGKSIREQRNPRIPVTVDIKMLINGKEVTNEDKSGSGSDEAKGAGGDCGCGKRKPEECTCHAPKEADVAGEKENDTDDAEMKQEGNTLHDMESPYGFCPKCGGKVGKDGKCTKCGYGAVTFAGSAARSVATWIKDGILDSESVDLLQKALSEKAGRMISQKNSQCIKECCDDMEDLLEKGYDMNKGGRSIVKGCHTRLKGLLDENATQTKPEESDTDEGELEVEKMTMEEAIAAVLTDATLEQRNHLAAVLKAMQEAEESEVTASAFRSLVES